ncbi:hypothetical protein PV08_01753 [Exophiala spinifera]|uniref:Uncharacterized protein n=1 Tax=Exophiala spinifera TaxID=91928 RepID=A0A0D2BQD5_9EURO|nr:uncharacterized protein PV08_01753 [Exophiala spinifera]KIW21173.1 hypothetical protein PV08_01753 [Exophiala spinifera]
MSPVHGKGKGKSQSWSNERDVIESPSPSFPPRTKKRPGLSGANDPTATKSDSALVKSKKNNRESLTASGHGQRRVASTPAYLHQ